eukprot:4962842-Prymnesium_polylepis.1
MDHAVSRPLMCRAVPPRTPAKRSHMHAPVRTPYPRSPPLPLPAARCQCCLCSASIAGWMRWHPGAAQR